MSGAGGGHVLMDDVRPGAGPIQEALFVFPSNDIRCEQPSSPIRQGCRSEGSGTQFTTGWPAMYAPAPLRRGLSRSGLLLLGPAFVAAVAYVDPGNFATNIAAGAKYGYLCCGGANLLAVLVQYLAGNASIATGKTLSQLCRDHFRRPVVFGLCGQAELVALATDLAEVVGGAIALNLLFDIPLLLCGAITSVVSFGLLLYQSRRGQRPFETAIIGLLAVILVGFAVSTIEAAPSAAGVVGGLVPRLDGTDSVVLAAGMLGATVMPHAIWLHGSLTTDRHGETLRTQGGLERVLKATRLDVTIAMALAGAVNLAMVVVAAAALKGSGIESLSDAHAAFGVRLGEVPALLFALAFWPVGSRRRWSGPTRARPSSTDSCADVFPWSRAA